MCRARCSFLELLILGILVNEGELHGYALYKRIVDVTQAYWRPSIGTMYRLLNDMARRGLVSRSLKGRRRSYTVTSRGLEYFIKASKPPLTRKAGVLATVLEAYFKLAEENPGIMDEDLKERLRTLMRVLEEHSNLIE